MRQVTVQSFALVITISVCLCQPNAEAKAQNSFILAERGKTEYRIVTSQSPSDVEQFAALELQKYLARMTGATFELSKGKIAGKTILLGAAFALPNEINEKTLGFDGYVQDTNSERILLAGVNDRGTLFAIYAFLEELGCRWFAPNFGHSGQMGEEVIPKADPLRVTPTHTVVRPSMKYRKEDVGEGLTHTVYTLRQMIDWMPKVRMNVFQAPLNYQGEGVVTWDNWRLDLIPELKKRGLVIEVGGHGYMNFLRPSIYFDKHPEWFGMIDGKRSNAEVGVVFETANPEAMKTFIGNIQEYLQSHPEIDIFDLWPPDSTRWSESPESQTLGDLSRRHALVVNAVAKMVKQRFPRVLVEFLAYQNYLFPPKDIQFEDNTVLDFCLGTRSFQAALWDEGNSLNRQNVQALQAWLKRDVFKGDIAFYTYYRKYAWRSLPIVIPKLILQEIKYYSSLGVNGIGLYSEPADWFTFELNNYAVARGAMNSDVDINLLLGDYARQRFGKSRAPIYEYFTILEKTTPGVCRISGTVVQSLKEIEQAKKSLQGAAVLLGEAERQSAGDGSVAKLVAKLQASLKYAANDIDIRLLAWRMSQGMVWNDESTQMGFLLKDHWFLVLSNKGEGIFLTRKELADY